MAISAASKRGYHFLDEYRVCPRKWFLHRVVGLEPTAMSAAPSMGSVLHAIQEDFFRNGEEDEEVYRMMIAQELELYRPAFFEDEDWDKAYGKLISVFKTWRMTFGHKDLQDYDIEGVELELRAQLPIGLWMTGRVDRLMRDRQTGALVLFDTKTTSWGPDTAHKKVEYGDQVTMYTWLLHQTYGDQPIEMIPDIAYLKPNIPTVHRLGAIRRTKEDVTNFVYGLCHDWQELEETLRKYETNVAPPEFLFPRHPTVCQEFGCDYADICRASFDEASPPPITGYRQIEKITLDELRKLD